MKKYMVLCAGLCVALAFSSCKSSESAYKKAYEKAKAQETQTAAQGPISTETPVVTPVVSGAGLQNYSVVVGSFSLKANAEGLQNTLKNAGYDAQIAYNSSRNMYRVVASTFADKSSAVQSRNQFRAGNYPDAWLLFKK